MAEFHEGWKGTMRIGDGPEIPIGNADLVIERMLRGALLDFGPIRAGGLHSEWSMPVNNDVIDALHLAWSPRAREAVTPRSPEEALHAGYVSADWINHATADGIWADVSPEAATDMIERYADRVRERALGVDPDRVIDGETVQPTRKEIEG
jgi:hypothetical protein